MYSELQTYIRVCNNFLSTLLKRILLVTFKYHLTLCLVLKAHFQTDLRGHLKNGLFYICLSKSYILIYFPVKQDLHQFCILSILGMQAVILIFNYKHLIAVIAPIMNGLFSCNSNVYSLLMQNTNYTHNVMATLNEFVLHNSLRKINISEYEYTEEMEFKLKWYSIQTTQVNKKIYLATYSFPTIIWWLK